MLTSRAVFLTNLSIMCLAKSKVMALRFKLAWATSEMSAPSNSRTLVVML